MKVIADKAKCCGHARCNVVAPDIFTLDDNGYIAVAQIPVPVGMEDQARRGVRACPERALALDEQGAVAAPAQTSLPAPGN
jgi:ferredoxin